MPDSALTDGTVLTSTFWTANVRNQVIATVTSGTRPSGTEGQFIYETDTDRVYVYSGSGWVEWGGIGAWVSYTPVLTQSAVVTKTVTYAKYSKMGRQVVVNIWLAVTGAGTANNAVTVSLPFTAASAGLAVGSGFIFDSSAGATNYPGVVLTNSTTTIAMIDASAATAGLYLGQTGAAFAAAFASGDSVVMNATYESTS